MSTKYQFDTRTTSRYEIEADIVDGAYGGATTLEEQAEAYSGDVEQMAQAIADFYADQEVQFVDEDGDELSVKDYAESYIRDRI